MKRVLFALLVLLSSTTMCSEAPRDRGRVSNAYHRVHDKLSNHKGKVGLAAGAIGTGIAIKVFKVEFDEYLKPFFKSVWKRTTGWFRRVFRSKKD